MDRSIVVVGGGIVGLTTGMLLARDGHRVTVLERDPAPAPAEGSEAWDGWARRSVSQFRQVHFLQPRFREVIERELPDAFTALRAAGAYRFNVLDHLPPQLTGGRREGDDRFTTLTARRPVLEHAFAVAAAATDGLEVRRGVVVRGLAAAAPADRTSVPRVVGVDVDGAVLACDLVVDAGGRRSALPAWLQAIGARPAADQSDESGFAYYTRHFRSDDGSLPPLRGSINAAYGSISIITLPADNGTWGVGVITSSKDRTMRAIADVDVWTAVVRSFPVSAHWVDAEPLTGVDMMTNVPDRLRSVVADAEPVVHGLLPVGDAFACTNPSVGRGITLGAMHAVELRDAIRETGVSDGRALALRMAERSAHEVEPWFHDTVGFDRHRLGQIEAAIAGDTYESDDPSWTLGDALAGAAPRDPDLFRHFLDIVSVHARGVDVLARPGVLERASQVGVGAPPPGPDRDELEAIVAAAVAAGPGRSGR